ncbi:STAS domain-containing protein [Leptospira sp. GIMC2001]|uniref:STAS domain-containing protein n=1 Tax=Leptospira sp. GIMC2001 TaxID=1513297 RepID=UPI002349CDDE|nr:STAS domain-containing protein [Leptospira sp. GIMC2001]WCL49792.1 STAS domain-containing protein [Leptospira sp. GIMC2001]
MNDNHKLSLEIDSGDMRMFRITGILPAKIEDSAAVIKLEGEINLYSSQHIKEIIEKLLIEGRNKIFIDLGDVTYIDSSGLGVFLGLHSKIYKAGGGINLCSPSQKVNYVLELTKLVGLLNIFNTLEEGMEVFANKESI